MQLSEELGAALLALDGISKGKATWVKPAVLDFANKLGLAVENRITEAGRSALKVYLEQAPKQLRLNASELAQEVP